MTYPRRLLFDRSEAEGVRRCGLWYFQEGGGENLWHFDAHVGCGHHLRAYGRRFSAPVFCSRCPLEETRRMGDGDPPQNRARYGCSASGALAEQTGSGTNPPFRPGSAVHLFELRKAARRGRFVPSMGRIGSAHDNSLAEGFVATLKSELLYRGRWPTREAARMVIFE
jgi:hypothetical protein